MNTVHPKPSKFTFEKEKRDAFLQDLASLINSYSLENLSDTPDWILAEHMLAALESFSVTSCAREKWYGRGPKLGGEGPTLIVEAEDQS